ncbi:MAG TPA: phosphoadenylyl-sulfate reductase [Myxococcales bacterium LLY-WYZ-16_1]|nr:phosphoadenylyl-sulfate reductase [Myxococcales bacterium LLY-WYZ-16_1]
MSPQPESAWAVDFDDPRAVLREAVRRFHPELVVASSFSMEDVLLMAMAVEVEPGIRVFSLDTGRLPEETYWTADAVQRKLEIQIEWQFPERVAVEELERTKGLYSFRNSLEDRHECCAVRKVEPLNRALSGVRAWVTGQRRAQSVTRSDLQVVEPNSTGPWKINPLARWSLDQVRSEVERRGLPIHPLYGRGYTSIGCAPCTRPVREGEDERAGRWWWERPEHKECGLHTAHPSSRLQEVG